MTNTVSESVAKKAAAGGMAAGGKPVVSSRDYFIHLSDIVGRPVFLNELQIGVVDDVYGSLEDIFPRIHGIVVRSRGVGGKSFSYAPLSDVTAVEPRKPIRLVNPPVASLEGKASAVVGFRRALWDKQIVDISGAKVIRVNDLHILKEGGDLWVVHIDAGVDGLLRRLGWYGPVAGLLKFLFKYEVPENIISWRHIEASGIEGHQHSLALRHKFSKLARLLPQDLAEILVDLGKTERTSVVRALRPETLAEAIVEVPESIRELILDDLADEALAKVVEIVPSDDAVELLEQLSSERRARLVRRLAPAKVSELESVLEFQDGTAGFLMNRHFARSSADKTAAEFLALFAREFSHVEFAYYVYLVDANQRLIGVASLREILGADPARPLRELCVSNTVTVETDTQVDDLFKLFAKYKFWALPVVDRHNHIKGVVTISDVLERIA
jgi:magnesium transporter